MERIGGLNRQQADQAVKAGAITKIGDTSEGVEILDARPLAARLSDPIKGRGIVRTFGATHFVVTESKARKLLAA